jgi:hypothetical protein
LTEDIYLCQDDFVNENMSEEKAKNGKHPEKNGQLKEPLPKRGFRKFTSVKELLESLKG